jgi:hypothetical protein
MSLMNANRAAMLALVVVSDGAAWMDRHGLLHATFTLEGEGGVRLRSLLQASPGNVSAGFTPEAYDATTSIDLYCQR